MFELVLFLSVYLCSIGIYGLITSRNMVRALICLELILNSINLNLVTFSNLFDSRKLKGGMYKVHISSMGHIYLAHTCSQCAVVHRVLS